MKPDASPFSSSPVPQQPPPQPQPQGGQGQYQQFQGQGQAPGQFAPQGQPQQYGQGQGQNYGGFPMGGDAMGVNPMMANMAMAYGSDFAAKGQEEIRRNLDKYVSIGQLKYYFAVDTSYVTRKLGERG